MAQLPPSWTLFEPFKSNGTETKKYVEVIVSLWNVVMTPTFLEGFSLKHRGILQSFNIYFSGFFLRKNQNQAPETSVLIPEKARKEINLVGFFLGGDVTPTNTLLRMVYKDMVLTIAIFNFGGKKSL